MYIFTDIPSTTTTSNSPVDNTTTETAVVQTGEEETTTQDEQIINISSSSTSGTVESSTSSSSSQQTESSPPSSTAEEEEATTTLAPFLPTAIPNKNNAEIDMKSEKPDSVAPKEKEESGAPAVTTETDKAEEMVAKKGVAEEKPKPIEMQSTGVKQGRAFSNFVTVAPNGMEKQSSFDLSDVSLDGGQEEEVAAEQPNNKKITEVTCSHEGKTFKVSKLTNRERGSSLLIVVDRS